MQHKSLTQHCSCAWTHCIQQTARAATLALVQRPPLRSNGPYMTHYIICFVEKLNFNDFLDTMGLSGAFGSLTAGITALFFCKDAYTLWKAHRKDKIFLKACILYLIIAVVHCKIVLRSKIRLLKILSLVFSSQLSAFMLKFFKSLFFGPYLQTFSGLGGLLIKCNESINTNYMMKTIT